MNLSAALTVAQKDLKSVRRKKSLLYSLIFFPLLLSLLFPGVIVFANRPGTGGIPIDYYPSLLNAFSFFFVIVAAVLPTAIASYSIVGEKVEKSLEPLLATPTTDGEILLGKSIAAFVPPLIAIYACSILYLILIDYITYPTLGYIIYPNVSLAIILFIAIPLSEILSIELSVIASSRATDVRAANQIGGLMFIPFMIIYVCSEIGLVILNNTNLLIISAIIFVVDIALFYLGKATFQREEILTKWK